MSSRSAAKSQQKANDLQLQMFHESRGSNGSAILPEYMKDSEAALGKSAADTVRALYGFGGGINNRLSDGTRTLARYNPAIEAGDNLVLDLATGKVASDRRTSLAPVLSARTAMAKSRAAAINQSLDETLAGLRTRRAASGFRGGGTFDTARMLDAMTGARMNAAAEIGQADLDNAMAMHDLDTSNLQLMLSGLDMPFQRGQQRLAFDSLPASTLAQFYSAINSPLDYFRLPVGTPPTLPRVQSAGELNGAALAGIGQAFGQYYGNKAMMQQLGSYFSSPGVTGTPVTSAYNNPSYMVA